MKRTIFLFLVLVAAKLSSQNCGSCTLVISGADTSSYTITSGQCIYFDSTAIFTGSLYLNGGIACNKGEMTPAVLSLTSGTLTNYAILAVPSNFTLSTGQQMVCGPSSQLRIGGSLSISGGRLVNQGILNIDNTFSTNSGTTTNTGIINCKSVTSGTNTITDSGIINIY